MPRPARQVRDSGKGSDGGGGMVGVKEAGRGHGDLKRKQETIVVT